jgi:SAM-dependent methyltransferase
MQIASIPADLQEFYPGDYYSLTEEKDGAGLFKRFIKRRRGQYALGGKSLLGRFAAKKFGIPEIYRWMSKSNLTHDSHILDVGSGSGFFLLKLHEEGFKNITGIDPYLKHDVSYANGLTTHRKQLSEVEDHFDFVMLNHSFEHMAEPQSVLKEIYRTLNPKRYAVIRIPIVPSYALETYGVNWVQWDAPRHLFLHSVESMRHLAEQAGFEISAVDYDSNALQFWGSELYARDISLNEYNELTKKSPESVLFEPGDIDAFTAKSQELNSLGEGDQACFYLFKQ